MTTPVVGSGGGREKWYAGSPPTRSRMQGQSTSFIIEESRLTSTVVCWRSFLVSGEKIRTSCYLNSDGDSVRVPWVKSTAGGVGTPRDSHLPSYVMPLRRPGSGMSPEDGHGSPGCASCPKVNLSLHAFASWGKVARGRVHRRRHKRQFINVRRRICV